MLKRIIVLLIFVVAFCSGCERINECVDCIETESKLDAAREEIMELEDKLDDLREIEDSYYELLGALEDIAGDIYYADECLSGCFGGVYVDEAASAISDALADLYKLP